MMKQYFLMVDFNYDHRRLIRELTLSYCLPFLTGTLHPLELFTADLDDEIKGLRNELFRLRMKGE